MSSGSCGCAAWIYKDDGTDQFAPHKGPSVSSTALAQIGILHYKIEGLDKDPKLEEIRTARGYTNFDVVEITKDTPMEKLKMFFEEHLHEDEEIRLCLEGSGYFDVRSKKDEWIRIHCTPGDLIVLPAGIYHRFTLDDTMRIKAMRLFTFAPKWIALPRTGPEADTTGARSDYIKFMKTTDGAGTPVIMDQGPASLANYPHARVVNGLVYLSGFSSRREVRNDLSHLFFLTYIDSLPTISM